MKKKEEKSPEQIAQEEHRKKRNSYKAKCRSLIRQKGLRVLELSLQHYQAHKNNTVNEELSGLDTEEIIDIHKEVIDDYKFELAQKTIK